MNDPDRALYDRIRAGDRSACAECIELHSPGVYRLALRLMRDEAEAEDVVQETFLNAFRAIDAFDGRSRLSTWLYRIAYNAALGRLRRPRPDQISVDEASEGAEDGKIVPRELFDWCCLPEEDFATAEAQAELEGAVRGLPDTMRAVFVLRELNGLSTEETAEALDVSQAVVKQRLHRARLWLRERLSDYFSELARSKSRN